MQTIKQTGILCLLVLLICFIISALFNSCTFNVEEQDKTVGTNEEISTEPYPDNPYDVVNDFFDNLIERSNNGTWSITTANNYLSKNSLLKLEPYSGSMLEKILKFAGAEKIPEGGFHIMGVIDIREDQAWVETRWNYTADHEKGIATVKTFHLIQEGEYWKIEAIK